MFMSLVYMLIYTKNNYVFKMSSVSVTADVSCNHIHNTHYVLAAHHTQICALFSHRASTVITLGLTYVML